MNAVPTSLLQQTEQLSESVTRPIPGSRKIFVPGSRPDLQVAMREIVPTPTPTLGTVFTIPGAVGLPTCITVAGKYDDVNGNGRKDFADVVLYFNQMTWIADHEPLEAFDYNGNGRIDFADVVWLFNHL